MTTFAAFDNDADNIVLRLHQLAQSRPHDKALVTVDASGEQHFSYAELAARVAALAAHLQQRHAPGERVLLLLDNDIHYVVGFFACLSVGLIAVPLHRPESVRGQHLQRLTGIAEDAGAACWLVTQATLAALQADNTPLAGNAALVAVDAAYPVATPVPHHIATADVAFLQYTSGSTSAPKGVMVTHANLMANEAAIAERLGVRSDDTFVSWLPLYHDMGLIGGLLQPLYRGIPVVLMSPAFFLERPVRWLEALSRHRGTISGGPDFAYRLCVDRIRGERSAGLDLSHWRVAFSGAEPVRYDTLNDFIDRFGEVGFSRDAVYPCYGLAESTLLVTGGQRGAGMHVAAFDGDGLRRGEAACASDQYSDPVKLVACGVSPGQHALRIADPATGAALPAGRVGEIWAAGPSIAAGYWRREQESAATFVERDGQRWLRTGDLGFIDGGQLFVTGRSKDMIIVRGQNLYPQDIERAIESEVELVRKGRVAAFSVPREHHPQGIEGIGVALEISRSVQKMVSPQVLIESLQESIAQSCAEAASVIILLNPGALPKTSSGKLQRSACRSGWLAATLDAYAIHAFGALTTSAAAPATAAATPAVDAVETELRAIWQGVMQIAPANGDAHFFRHGGNSLKAVQLAAAIGAHWRIDFPVRQLFEQPQLWQVAQTVRDALAGSALPATDRHDIPALSPVQRQTPLPLSPAQHSLWTTWQLDPDSPAYNMPGVLHLDGALDVAALAQAIDDLVARHAILRTIYLQQPDGEPRQLALGMATGVLGELIDVAGDEAQARQLLQRFSRAPFALAREIPLRAMLVRCSAQRHLLGLSLHHIAGDGWSLPILMDELTVLYTARSQGAEPTLAAPALQFADYAVWQRARLSQDQQQRQLDFWRARLGDEHAPLPLPHGRRQAAADDAMPEARHGFSLPAPIAQAFKDLCAAHGVSLYMGMLALLNVLLYRSTGSADLRIGSPMADRGQPQTQAMIGYLINLQVLRTRLDSRAGFDALLLQVRDTVLAAQQHQDVSFDMVVKALQPERMPHVHPLCQVKCTERAPLPQWQGGGIAMRLEELSGGHAHFDLSLDFTATADGIDCLLVYAATRFHEDEVQALATALVTLAQQAAARPQQPLAQWQWPAALAPVQAEALAWAHGDVISAWRQQVAANPQALAVVDEHHALSAAELQAQVEHLAGQLRQQGVGVESRVGIASSRQVEFVIGVLATLRAGGCYVPLDPQLPDERLAYQMGDSGIDLLLATPEGERLRSLPGAPAAWLPLALARQPLPADGADFSAPHPQQAAYLIYTSGSTGRPKGVVVTHGGLANYMQGVLSRLDLPPTVRSMGMVSTVAADLGHTSFFGALCSGRSLHLLSAQAAFDPALFAATMQAHAIDVLKIVPSHLQALLQGPEAAQVLPRHTLIVGGESTSASLLQQIHALRPACRVLNHYGPTETTVGVLTQPLAADQAVALGLPLPNLRMLVLDADLNPVPPGAAGELYMGGVALARGYQGRPAATAERFIADPSGSGERLYRSGDRVRIDTQGRLVFLGRQDDQVKIRGYRVEPQEVASVLCAQPGVAAAEVLASQAEDGRLQLCAYVVGQADAGSLRAQLAALLPDYMVPAYFVMLASLPLNANGKIDRRALPLPASQSEAEVTPLASQAVPQGAAETAIAQVWQEVLGVAQVSRHDNFFALGGDSILTLKIVARLKKAGWRITPRQLMQSQDLASLATVAVAIDGQGAAPVAVVAPAQQALPLTPVQQWFFSHHAVAPAHWNQSVLLEGPANTPVAALRAAVMALSAQHEALRLRFSPGADGVWHQTVKAHAEDCFEAIEVHTAADRQAAIDRAQRSLDLTNGPLWRVLWLTAAQRSSSTATLVLVAHHLVIDGVSWRILLEDLQSLLAGGAPPMPGAGFSQWALAVAKATPQLPAAERSYWQRIAAIDEPDLPCTPATTVGRRDDNTVGNAAREQIEFDSVTTGFLLGDAHGAYRTRINDLLLSATAQTLCEWASRERILIEVEGHGREELPGDAQEPLDLSRTVGWFTALYPVQLVVTSGAPGDLIKSIKEQLRQVPRNGLGYGLWRSLQPGQPVAQPQVTFNYLGRFEALSADAQWRLLPRDNALADLERDPASPRRSLLELNAMVVDGRLQVQCVYCRTLHQSASIAALLQDFARNLRSLLAHCADVSGGATPSDFPLAGLTQGQLDAVLDSLPAARVMDLYPLSPMQSGMFFHALMAPQASAYLNQLRVNLHRLDAARFQAAWQQVAARHDILRSGFIEHAERPLQWVAKECALSLHQLDWRGRSDLDSALEALAATEHARGVELMYPPLMRLTLVRVSEQQHHLIWTRHHLLLDGWSTQQLIGEVLRVYRGAALATPGLRYRDYIGWLQQQDRGAAEAFWRAQLQPLAEPVSLVNSLPPVRRPATGQQCCAATLDLLATAQLQAFARDRHCTVNTLVQAAWSLVLQRYSRQSTVVFGATVAGRSSELEGADELLGLFINTVPIVAQLHPAMTVQQLLDALQATNLAVREFDATPLYEIQSWGGQGGQALFDSILVFENYPLDLAVQAEQDRGLRMEVVNNREETHYPMTVVATLTETLRLEWRVDTLVIEPASAEAILQHMQMVLQQLVGNPDTSLGKLMLLPPEQQARMTALSINAETHGTGNVLALIEAQASHLPALRVPHTGQALSYGQLNEAANALAHWLIAQGAGPDQRVGVCMERSQEMVVALLAIMKAGAAYVPMDPDHPPQRLQYFIEDSRTSLLLTHAPVLPHLQALPASCTLVDVGTLALDAQARHNPGLTLHPEQLAYVIYTSGSTGQPKGAANRHVSLYNRLAWMQQAYQLGTNDRVLQKTPFGFDVSVWEFFWPLMTGAELVMAAPGEHRDPARLAELIDREGITTLHFVPSMLQAFVNDGDGVRCASLRRVICSGEALPMELQQQAQRQLPHAQLINLYGPTEAAIDVTHWTCLVNDTSGSVPIGRPISATQAFVLDESMQLVPPGVAGELYLGGINLARGYLGKPELTAQRFVANPFADDGQRLYRTGDLVRWRDDGQIMYLGRLDHQVKIRGLRIELGEIEAALLAQPGVREAVVVAADGQTLVAYVSGAGIDEATVREALGQRLPDYMVPSVIMQLPNLPLSTNGKIDRKALPAVERTNEQTYAEPQGEIEQQLAAIWQEVLGIARVGRDDNFFALGGHSLLATSVLARWRALHGQSALSLRMLFATPVLRTLAAELAAASSHGAPVLELQAARRQPRMPLSPMQQRLWLVNRLQGGSAAYNMTTALQLDGQLSEAALRHTLQALIARHEILRTGYHEDDEGEPFASIAAAGAGELQVIDLRHHDAATQQAELERESQRQASLPFDLGAPPLLRAVLLQLAPGVSGQPRHVLLLALHHIVADGWSIGLLVSDFSTLYRDIAAGAASTLPPPGLQYIDYAAWQQHGRQAARETDEQFWRQTLAGASGQPALPADVPREGAWSSAGARLSMQIPAELSTQLNALAQRSDSTLFMLLLSSFQLLVHRLSGQDDLLIGTDVAGREHRALEQMVGFFVNVLPLRSRVTPAAGFADLLKATRESVLDAFAHQALPFERIADVAGSKRDRRWNPLVQLLFVLQNMPTHQFDLPQLQVQRLPARHAHAKFDIALFVTPEQGALQVEWVYASALFRPATMQRIAHAWASLLAQIVAHPDWPLSRFDIASLKEPLAMQPTATVPAAPAVQPGKFDKLSKLKGLSAGAPKTPAPPVRMSPLRPGSAFPLLIEATSADIDTAAWARDNQPLIAELLGRHGGVLFRRFGLKTPQDFERFAEAIEPELYGSYGDLPKKEGGNKTYRSTPYPEKQMILYHNESAHIERWPRKQWFFCELPSPVGGATPIVDCREMLQRLPIALRREFEQKQLLYVRTFTPRLDVSWQSFFQTDDRAVVEARLEAAGTGYRWLDDDTLQTSTRCPAVIVHPLTGAEVFFNQVQLHHPYCLEPEVRRDLLSMVGPERLPRNVLFGDGSVIPDATMELIGQLYEQCAVRFDWQQGDVVMLDNMLAAHARDPYEGPRKIVVAMGAMVERAEVSVPATAMTDTSTGAAS
ncbi:non-ribosomal peptide synthetase [Herbaspirillum sp. alder98]|uniref:non-ribosomal peptide synthetase n=1 Tax=Herbaspirillum sp. alder98 TaxID=2913096 RepID=UPI001CD88F3B|nr:non-ribosomal peptide synthetase [Herbaspirillum sp. alder98]MCA1323720.1 amino acid adenylation domain-containing protein [Herbaspirillum sp. alder98]